MKVFFVLALITLSILCSVYFKDDLTTYGNKIGLSKEYRVEIYTNKEPDVDCEVLNVNPYYIVKTNAGNAAYIKEQIKKQGIEIKGETIIINNLNAADVLSKFKVVSFKKTKLTDNTTLFSCHSNLFNSTLNESENMQVAVSNELVLVGIPRLLGSY